MLTGRSAAGVVLGATLSLFAGAARAQSDEVASVLYRPKRLTISDADELLGVPARSEQTLYFVSNRNKTSQIFAQDAEGRAKLLFDDDADVTWPRVSPDGTRLLYVSFGEHALGQLCIRNLPDGGDRRCLADPSAISQAEWVDSSRIVAVARQSTHSELRAVDVRSGSTLSARPLLDRSVAAPAISPDGQWLVYVPVERDFPTIGPAFASHGGRWLEAVRLGSPNAPATPLWVDLPGLTGQPAFAQDGRSIYVVQFIGDSNHDGVIDANDDGILFRVPFSTDGPSPALGPPEQLTEASYNCAYPAPGADRLIATCARGHKLGIFALPVDGEVPASWTADRLAAEAEVADSRVEQQLLAARRLVRETSTKPRCLALLSLVRLHLELEQYQAAEFYAARVAAVHDESTVGLSGAVLALVDQRRAIHDRERGLLVGRFTDQARARLEDLHSAENASPVAVAFGHVVKSEVADSIGDKALARVELEAVSLDATAPAPIVEAYYERADALYRELDDREALVGVGRRLSEDRALTPDERLHYAMAAAHAMVRGAPFDQAMARLIRERADVANDSELAFALDAGRAVIAIREAHPTASVTEALVTLFERQARPARRRALVDDATKQARAVGADGIVEELAQHSIDDAPRGTRERRLAERMYRRVMTRRALRRAAEGRTDEARADFDAIVQKTGSYEAAVGSIDLRLSAGESPASIEANSATRGTLPALSAFTKAYAVTRELPALEGDAVAAREGEALALLRASWPELRDKRMAQALRATLLHNKYIRTGDLVSAERADTHYTIALELMSRDPQFRAMVLGQLGILHGEIGNYRISLRYLEDRGRFPHAGTPESLAVHLTQARALLHVGREGDAATAADEALEMVDREPALAAYRILVLDRDALSNFAAGRFSRAMELYDAEMPRLDAATGPSARRNRFVVRIARAAAAVGADQPSRALADLAQAKRDLDDARLVADLTTRGSGSYVGPMYRLIAAGLSARAYRELDRPDDEARELGARREMLQERFATTHRAEYEQDAMLAEAQLALNARDRRDPAGAAFWLGHALARADDLRARARGQIDRAQLDVLWLAAQLGAQMKTALLPDLPARLENALRAIATRDDLTLRFYARWFEIYLPMISPATPYTP